MGNKPMNNKKKCNGKFKGFGDYETGKVETNVAYFNGYEVGDRILEGVMFKAEIDAKGIMYVSFVDDPETDPYLHTLNHKYWLGLAASFAVQNDIFCDNVSGSGEELCLLEVNPKPVVQRMGTMGMASSLADVLVSVKARMKV